MKKNKNRRWAWVLTGSGHFFNECIELIHTLEDVDVFISKAAEEVLVMYKKNNKISSKVKIYKDNSASSVSVGKFYKNESIFISIKGNTGKLETDKRAAHFHHIGYSNSFHPMVKHRHCK